MRRSFIASRPDKLHLLLEPGSYQIAIAPPPADQPATRNGNAVAVRYNLVIHHCPHWPSASDPPPSSDMNMIQ